MKYTICHLTVAHKADDVRIFTKQCVSLSKIKDFKVFLCSPGVLPLGSNVVHFKIPEPNSSRIKRIIKSQLIALNTISRIKADVWHIHDPELLPVASLLILMKKRVIWDSHENYHNQFNLRVNYRDYIPKYIKGGVNLVVRFFLKFVDKNAHGVVCATQLIAEKYSNPNRVIVGNEAILGEFKLCKPQYGNSRVIFIGSPNLQSCYKEVVDAIARIPELKLVVGSKYFNENLLEYSREVLNSRFEYKGWLARNELVDEISKSSIGLVTYGYNLNHQDNKPNKFFEFCAAGLPIVATPTPFMNDLISSSQAGVLSMDFTSSSIEKALIELVTSENKWLDHSKSGKSWSARHGDWLKSESELLKLYFKILS